MFRNLLYAACSGWAACSEESRSQSSWLIMAGILFVTALLSMCCGQGMNELFASFLFIAATGCVVQSTLSDASC